MTGNLILHNKKSFPDTGDTGESTKRLRTAFLKKKKKNKILVINKFFNKLVETYETTYETLKLFLTKKRNSMNVVNIP